jgi:hypothetical protein
VVPPIEVLPAVPGVTPRRVIPWPTTDASRNNASLQQRLPQQRLQRPDATNDNSSNDNASSQRVGY